MIVITGAAGFIGSVLVGALNAAGYEDLLLVDDFSREDKARNYESKKFIKKIDRTLFLNYFSTTDDVIDFVFHLGARTDTTEVNVVLFNQLNLNYSKEIWKTCSEKNIPLVYASSAATYGLGELGYVDDHEVCQDLHPLNAYGHSKNNFDIWMLKQEKQPPFWAGLKFFNVYGPNEYHKGRMASVIFHTHQKIKATGEMQLFRSHRPDFKDGEQMRDFIYVKDVVDIALFLMEKRPKSGIYNVGTGKARTFWDLAAGTFDSMDLLPKISFMDTPEDIREKYQYFTQASMQKLRAAGYDKPFHTLEEGIRDYVQNYLEPKVYL